MYCDHMLQLDAGGMTPDAVGLCMCAATCSKTRGGTAATRTSTSEAPTNYELAALQ